MPTLFPILALKPTGLARLAAEAEYADEGHLIEFRTMQVRSILNKSVSKRQLSLAYSINPYRGCEFGCKYCYARYTHEFLAPAVTTAEERAQDSAVGTARGDLRGLANLRDPEAFERKIFLKENAAWLLEQELKKIDPAKEIALGTATDPYQPIERKALVTRSILEVFARQSGYRLGIVTKSRLIERDVDLLSQIARKNTLVVHLTITTTDAELARKLEPRAPRPDLRFAAVRRLREAGVTVGILCSPLLPGITDTAEALEQMARQAAAVGASFFAAQPLFLKSCSRPTYLNFIREQFPALESDYARRFADRDFADASYRQHLARIVKEACRRNGLNERSSDALLTRDVGLLSKLVANLGARSQGMLFA
jgi:DNA repair photolyase